MGTAGKDRGSGGPLPCQPGSLGSQSVGPTPGSRAPLRFPGDISFIHGPFRPPAFRCGFFLFSRCTGARNLRGSTGHLGGVGRGRPDMQCALQRTMEHQPGPRQFMLTRAVTGPKTDRGHEVEGWMDGGMNEWSNDGRKA